MVNVAVTRKISYDPMRRLVIEIREVCLSDPSGADEPFAYCDVTVWPVEMFVEMEESRPKGIPDELNLRITHPHAIPVLPQALEELKAVAGMIPDEPEQNWWMN